MLSCGPAGKWNAYESVRLPQPPSYLTFFGAFAMQNLIYNRKWAWIPANLPVEVCSKRKSQGCGLQSMCGYPLFRLLALTDSSVPKKKDKQWSLDPVRSCFLRCPLSSSSMWCGWCQIHQLYIQKRTLTKIETATGNTWWYELTRYIFFRFFPFSFFFFWVGWYRAKCSQTVIGSFVLALLLFPLHFFFGRSFLYKAAGLSSGISVQRVR